MRARAVRHGLWVVASLTIALVAAKVAVGDVGLDSHAYWRVWRADHLYAAAPQQHDAYLYSPAFAQLIWPLTLVPWPAFYALWTAALAAIYWWLLKPLDWAWRAPALLLCSLDIESGNVWALFALVIVLGFRYPGAWVFPILTKVTPGVGLVWFGARREWRSLGIAVATLIVVVGASVISVPHLWSEWLRLLSHPDAFRDPARGTVRPFVYPSSAVGLAVTLPLSVALTVHAARRNRPWLLPVAMVFAAPVFTANALALLAAIPRLRVASSPDPPARGEYAHPRVHASVRS